MYCIKCMDIFGQVGIFSGTYTWGKEVKINLALYPNYSIKKYSSKGRAEQGIKALDKKLSDIYYMEVIETDSLEGIELYKNHRCVSQREVYDTLGIIN